MKQPSSIVFASLTLLSILIPGESSRSQQKPSSELQVKHPGNPSGELSKTLPKKLPPLRRLGNGMCFLTPHRLLDLRIGAGELPDKGRWDLEALMKSFALFGTDGLVIEISDSKSDWKNLPKLLDITDKLNRVQARVWVAIRTPVDGGNSEPFLGAYIRWAEEIAKLAKKHPSLVALYIPKIYRGKNLFIIHPGKLARMRAALRPQGVSLIGQIYDLIPENISDYSPYLDGIVLQYTNTQSPLNLESFLFMAKKLSPKNWKVLGGYSLGPNLFSKKTPPPWLVTYFIRHAMFRCDGFCLDTLESNPDGSLKVGGKTTTKKERKSLLIAMLQSIRKYWRATPLPSKRSSK